MVIADPGSTGNRVQGNFIGTDAAGTSAVPNLVGVELDDAAGPNLIGGATAAARNVISGNAGPGVFLDGAGTTGNTVQGNFIGVAADGTTPLGNAAQGVFITNEAVSNTVGGAEPKAGNVIADNSGDGVLIGSTARHRPAGAGNSVLGNAIFDNGGAGIDLGPDDGVTPNDPGDADAGPNDLQNFPVLASAVLGGGRLVVRGTLDSSDAAEFRIEFFASPAADPTGDGEGRRFLGAVTVSRTLAGINFTASLAAAGVLPGEAVTVTATDLATGDTSEFSAAVATT